MSVYIITGRLGSYKTTLATIWSLAIYGSIPWIESIKGNFKMNVPCFEFISTFDDLLDTYNSVVVIDEIHEHANSRRSSAQENIALTKLGTITRKHNIEMLCIAPRYGSIDINIRGIADYVISVQLKGDKILQSVYEPHPFNDDELVLLGENIYRESDLKQFYKFFDTRDTTRDFTKNAKLKS